VRRFGSVAAFVAEYAAGATDDPVAAEILAALDPESRRAVAARAQPPAERQAWLREQTGREWSAAWLAHVEQRAFVHLRRALQERGMWQP
jgi:hypothetical protein